MKRSFPLTRADFGHEDIIVTSDLASNTNKIMRSHANLDTKKITFAVYRKIGNEELGTYDTFQEALDAYNDEDLV